MLVPYGLGAPIGTSLDFMNLSLITGFSGLRKEISFGYIYDNKGVNFQVQVPLNVHLCILVLSNMLVFSVNSHKRVSPRKIIKGHVSMYTRKRSMDVKLISHNIV